MAAATANKAKISLKVIVHKEESRVIFAEADNNFVDTLFSIMTLTMGTIVRLLAKRPDENFKPLGSLRNLYQSLKDLPANYLSTDECKFMLLNPRSSSYDHCKRLKLNLDDTEPTKYYICASWGCTRRSGALFSTSSVARCSYCGTSMNREICLTDSNVNTGGHRVDGGVFVSDVATFIVTNDLRVMPNSSGCSIQLLRDLGITDTSHLEERTVDIGLDEMLDLLEWALLFKNPLTYLVFPRTHLVQDFVYLRQGNSVQHLISNDIATNSKRMTLKFTCQKSTCKFLFAEAEDDFVEFVFGFLEIPLGTAIGRLLNGNSCMECLDNLFASISDMSVERYIKSQEIKDMLLQPQLEPKYLSQNQIFPLNVAKFTQFYCNSYRFCGLANFSGHMARSIKYFGEEDCVEDERCDALTFKDPRVQGRFLKGTVKFLLTDDLVITPLSSFSTISMLNKLKVSPNDVEEREVIIGIEEGLKILKASLNSLSTLTDALLQGIKPN